MEKKKKKKWKNFLLAREIYNRIESVWLIKKFTKIRNFLRNSFNRNFFRFLHFASTSTALYIELFKFTFFLEKI